MPRMNQEQRRRWPVGDAACIKAEEPKSQRTIAAARQKEMKVSITEDATMSRTRSEGGAAVVRVVAIAGFGAAAGYLEHFEMNVSC